MGPSLKSQVVSCGRIRAPFVLVVLLDGDQLGQVWDYLGSGSKQGQQKKLFDRELRNYSGDNGSFDGRVM